MKRGRIRRLGLHKQGPGRWMMYLAGRSLLLLFEMAGLTWGRRLGAAFGRAVHALDGRHRRIAVDNVLRARGLVSDEREARSLVRRMYEHLGMSMAEIGMTDRLLRGGRLGELVRIRGLENVRAALARRRGGILAVAHLGNWEPAGVEFSLRHQPLHSIYRPLDNPLMDRYLESLRSRTGQVVIPKQNAAERMKRVLLGNGLLGVLLDQDARDDGVFVDFFGRPASTVKSVAVLSLRYRSAILPLNIYREAGRIWMDYEAPIWPEAVEGARDRVRALTQIVTSRLEEFIRRHPEQWLWIHRRWRTQPSEPPNGGDGGV